MQPARIKLLSTEEIQQNAADVYGHFQRLGPLTDNLRGLFVASRRFSRLLVQERVGMTEHIRHLEAQIQELEEAAQQQVISGPGHISAEEHEAIKTKAAALQEQLNSAEMRLQELDTGFRTNQVLLDQATRKLDEIGAVLAQREARIKEMESGSPSLNAERAERQRLTMELSDARVAHHMVSEEAARMRRYVDQHREELAAAIERASVSASRVLELDAQVSSLMEANIALNEKLEHATVLNDELRSTVEELRQAATRPVTAPDSGRIHEERLEAVMRVVRARGDKLKLALADVDELKAQLAAAHADATGYRGKVMLVERRAKAAEEGLRGLQESVNASAARLTPLLSPAKRIMFGDITAWDGPTLNMLTMEIMEQAITVSRGAAASGKWVANEADLDVDTGNKVVPLTTR